MDREEIMKMTLTYGGVCFTAILLKPDYAYHEGDHQVVKLILV